MTLQLFIIKKKKKDKYNNKDRAEDANNYELLNGKNTRKKKSHQ